MKKSATMLASAILVLSFAASASAGTAVVKATNSNTFSPKVMSVHKGTKVVWKNPSSRTHTVTANSSNWSKSATIASGASTSFTFRKLGTYRYRCTIHSGMTGKIIVS